MKNNLLNLMIKIFGLMAKIGQMAEKYWFNFFFQLGYTIFTVVILFGLHGFGMLLSGMITLFLVLCLGCHVANKTRRKE